MDLEQFKNVANELLKILDEELKGCQKYTFQQFINNTNSIIGQLTVDKFALNTVVDNLKKDMATLKASIAVPEVAPIPNQTAAPQSFSVV